MKSTDVATKVASISALGKLASYLTDSGIISKSSTGYRNRVINDNSIFEIISSKLILHFSLIPSKENRNSSDFHWLSILLSACSLMSQMSTIDIPALQQQDDNVSSIALPSRQEVMGLMTTIYVNVESSSIRRPQDILLGAAPVLSDHTLWGTINEFRFWSGVFSESSARVS